MLVPSYGQRTIADVVEMYRSRRLNLSPAFQRQSVWTTADREGLIQSVLKGIPLPSIYLYRQIGTGGIPKYDVIDGKQRLETLLRFLGKGPLAHDGELWVRAALEDEAAIEWWTWADFPTSVKNQFLSTELATIEVTGDLGEIIDLFVRINATGKRLTGQEKRHARYYASPVLRVAQRLADELKPVLTRHGIVTQSQVQRMKHVELITELLLSISAGRPLNKKTKIDEVIRGAALDQGELQDAAVRLRRALRLVVAILPDLKTTRFHNGVDFYSLALLFDEYKEEGKAVSARHSSRNALAGALLRDFGRGVDEVSDLIRHGHGARSDQESFREYLLTVRSDTDSFKQRMSRERLLRSVLDHVFDDRDAVRLFNTTQRRIVWHASKSKKCVFCQRAIRRWEDMSVDHVRPHIKGGKTELTNAALAHRRCNAKAGAKHAA